jgi:hypothetical protein
MKTIEGVPDTVDREKFLAALTDFGFDVNRVQTLDINGEGLLVRVKQKADGSDGDRLRDTVAKHVVWIPLV